MSEQTADPSNILTSIADIEAVIGKPATPVLMKVIDHIDAHAMQWLAASSIGFFAFSQQGGIDLTLGGGAKGFVSASKDEMRVPLAMLDQASLAKVGAGFGSLFVVQGKRETLRVNGTVAEVTDSELVVKVDECYGHCAKAFIRSDLWAASPRADLPDDKTAWLNEVSFMVIATCDADGRTDVSPKGDPAGQLIRQAGDDICFAERPGNRRADGFHNIVAQPHVAVATLVPGVHQVAIIKGAAQLTTDEPLRNEFVVEGKTPKLVVCLKGSVTQIGESKALAQAKLWPAEDTHAELDAAKMFAAHIKTGMSKSVAGRVAGAALSAPGVMKTALNADYKTNLY